MRSFERPDTYRVRSGQLRGVRQYRRFGDSDFPAAQRQYVVAARRAKGFVTTPKVQLGRNTARLDSRHTKNPSGFSPGRLHNIRQTVPGKAPRSFGPGFNRWGVSMGIGVRNR